MKPRVTLAHTRLADDTELVLHEHDGRPYLTLDGVQTAGPATRASEEGLARLATSPFRPVRQPRVWIAGLGLGEIVQTVCEALPQKRALFHVAEPCRELPTWLDRHLDRRPLDDARVVLGRDIGPGGLAAGPDPWHAILVHADTTPALAPGKAPFEDHRWLTAAFDSLREGGLLAIAASAPVPKLERHLTRVGFRVARHEIDVVPQAKRPRLHPLWLARKGSPLP
jgi:hypothetical protein